MAEYALGALGTLVVVACTFAFTDYGALPKAADLSSGPVSMTEGWMYNVILPRALPQ